MIETAIVVLISLVAGFILSEFSHRKEFTITNPKKRDKTETPKVSVLVPETKTSEKKKEAEEIENILKKAGIKRIE
jgi:hypothetical protein